MKGDDTDGVTVDDLLAQGHICVFDLLLVAVWDDVYLFFCICSTIRSILTAKNTVPSIGISQPVSFFQLIFCRYLTDF